MKFCPSDSSAYFPSKDASFSLSCWHQEKLFKVNKTEYLQQQHANVVNVLTFWSMTSRLFFSLWKFSLSCWACNVICEDCFFSVISRSCDKNQHDITTLYPPTLYKQSNAVSGGVLLWSSSSSSSSSRVVKSKFWSGKKLGKIYYLMSYPHPFFLFFSVAVSSFK